MLWSGRCLCTLCSLWNPTQCKTACRYPHPLGPVIQTLNPLTDCFRWMRPQQQLNAATDSWFVPDFMVQERPTLLSARRITEWDKWHHACICTAVASARLSTQHTPSMFEHCLDSKLQQLTENEKRSTESYQVTLREVFGLDWQLLTFKWISLWLFARICNSFLCFTCEMFVLVHHRIKKKLVYGFFFPDKTQNPLCLSHMWALQLLFSA